MLAYPSFPAQHTHLGGEVSKPATCITRIMRMWRGCIRRGAHMTVWRPFSCSDHHRSPALASRFELLTNQLDC
jgi:hypothetical protein